jgi:hypothetical protein
VIRAETRVPRDRARSKGVSLMCRRRGVGSRSIGRRRAPSTRGGGLSESTIFQVLDDFRFPIVLIKNVGFAFGVGIALSGCISHHDSIGFSPEPPIAVGKAFLQDGQPRTRDVRILHQRDGFDQGCGRRPLQPRLRIGDCTQRSIPVGAKRTGWRVQKGIVPACSTLQGGSRTCNPSRRYTSVVLAMAVIAWVWECRDAN